jgi:hypothetical protein
MNKQKRHLSPILYVRNKLEIPKKQLAIILGINECTIYRWMANSGKIPVKYHKSIIDYAVSENIKINEKFLLHGSTL